jgi:hypothetical protein
MDLIAGVPEFKVDTLVVGRSMAYYGSDLAVQWQVFLPFVKH